VTSQGRSSTTHQTHLLAFFSTSSSYETGPVVPTRHSLKGPPSICRDPVALQELTQQVLETSVGSLFCQKRTATISTPSNFSIQRDRDEAYGVAQQSSQLIEYLLRGYNHQFPGSLYGFPIASASGSALGLEEASTHIETMMNLIDRLEQEGEMYLQLRHEAYSFRASATALVDAVSSANKVNTSMEDDSSSSSSSSSSENDSLETFEGAEDEEIEIGSTTFGEVEDLFSSLVQSKHQHDLEEHASQGSGVSKEHEGRSHLYDFAKPGVTITMYDAILDAMACATEMLLLHDDGTKKGKSQYANLKQLEPADLYDVLENALTAHKLNSHSETQGCLFPYTVPTMATYNATLRGIGNLCLAAGSADAERKQSLVDQGLAYGFGVFNHLTHNDHGLPKRNTASVIYLLGVVKACFPPSRTRGNITVTLWDQASREGLVTPDLIAAIQDLHAESNGPEFQVFLDALEKCQGTIPSSKDGKNSKNLIIMPQRFARFVKKYQHSKNY
jgi:hypothetical protein